MPYADDEKAKAYHRQRYKDNPTPYVAYALKHRHTPRGREIKQMSQWRCKGIRNIDKELYAKWLNMKKCELCHIELTDDRYTTPTRRCLEHDHISGYVRSICCTNCNNYISGIDKTRHILLLELHRYFKINLE
tara:strand:- start:255 stop:653 length:399 start_codon:yes stop_codon:yes gene_type:complete